MQTYASRKSIIVLVAMFAAHDAVVACDANVSSFEEFYGKFRHDVHYQFEHIKFPLRVIEFTYEKEWSFSDEELSRIRVRKTREGSALYPRLRMIEADKFIGYHSIFPDQSVMKGNELEGVEFLSQNQYNAYIKLADGTLANLYKFQKHNGCWVLVEFEDSW